jgi:hypothetical protein
MAWLTDIRKVALLACVTSVLSLVMAEWIGRPAAPLPLLTLLLTALLPIFYLALYRDKRSFWISERLRLLARTAAFILGVLLALQLAERIKSPPISIPTLLDALDVIANILLLAAISRDVGERPQENTPVSTLLYVATKVTVIAWGVWVAFTFLRLLLVPYTYSQLRDYALQMGRPGPPLLGMVKLATKTLLLEACTLAAPYIIYRSFPSPTASIYTDPSDTAPPGAHSPDSSPGT